MHDEAVNRLFTALDECFRDDPRYAVLSRAYWRPLREFQNCVYQFDIVIVDGAPAIRVESGRPVLSPNSRVVTLIDVLSRDGYEEEFYDKPDSLTQSSAYEYCLYDPTAEALRPAFQAYRKNDGVFRILKSSAEGVFFSACHFRLDVNGESITARPSGHAWHEEELFACFKLYERAKARSPQDEAQIVGLETKINRFRERLKADRGESP